jgi:hypothetical protein
VATAQLLPIYRTISRKILRRTARSSSISKFEIVEGFDLFLLALSCPSHAWTWPRANNEERFGGYDSHQTCHKCMSRRMFDTHGWQSGPIYRFRDISA